jgi:hypothetical protein
MRCASLDSFPEKGAKNFSNKGLEATEFYEKNG